MKLDLSNVLILSPHRDDEALGVGGLITSSGIDQIHVRYFNTVHPNVDQQIYDQEALAVAKYGQFETSVSPLTGVNKLDRYPVAEFVDDIEKTINKLHPQVLIIPAPSYNQDHRVIYDASITAIRIHDINWRVPVVLLMEQPETHTPAYATFNPQLFIPINIDNKITLYSLYESQLREHRSVEHIKALARVRGMQCGAEYAESFEIIRAVV